MRGGIRKYDRGCELGKPLPTQYLSSINRLVAIVAAVIGIQTVARQLIGKGDISMGRKAKKFTKIESNLNVRFGSVADMTAADGVVR